MGGNNRRLEHRKREEGGLLLLSSLAWVSNSNICSGSDVTHRSVSSRGSLGLRRFYIPRLM